MFFDGQISSIPIHWPHSYQSQVYHQMEAFSGLERARMLLLLAHINHNKPWSETMKTGWVSWGTVTGVKKDSKDASTEQLLQDSDCSELALSEHRVSFCFPQS